VKRIIGIVLSVFSLTVSSETEYCADGVNQVVRPSSEFIILKDKGLVIDKRTQLMWKLCPEGFLGESCLYPKNEAELDKFESALFDYSHALGQAKNSTYADFSDWKLPNVKQSRTIVEHSCFLNVTLSSTILMNSSVFPIDPSFSDLLDESGNWYIHWTNTPSVQSEEKMELAGDFYGVSRNRKGLNTVLLVRTPSKEEIINLINSTES
jgi:hypothetical protein